MRSFLGAVFRLAVVLGLLAAVAFGWRHAWHRFNALPDWLQLPLKCGGMCTLCSVLCEIARYDECRIDPAVFAAALLAQHSLLGCFRGGWSAFRR